MFSALLLFIFVTNPAWGLEGTRRGDVDSVKVGTQVVACSVKGDARRCIKVVGDRVFLSQMCGCCVCFDQATGTGCMNQVVNVDE
ncbi:MAG: hypothetical protein ACR2P5_02340 [Gammaproteobacteria bacterium]